MEAAVDEFFDFVIIDKDDIMKEEKDNKDRIQARKQEKLEREQKNLTQAQAEMVVDASQKSESIMSVSDGKAKLEDFKIIKVIDKGSFGKVFHVINSKDNKEYAMKRINKDILIEKGQIINTKTEKDILFQAKSPFILTMDYVFQNEHRIYFFLEYVRGGNIFDHLVIQRRFSEPQVKFIAAQVLIALGYLHANKIVHRDLKPENVLVEENGYIKLADFGLAKFLQQNQDTKSFCGTAEYLAPEILDMKGHNFSVDWWTLGVLIYEMTTGRPPFMHQNHHKLGQLIRQGHIIFPHPERHGIKMSDELKDIITKLLERDSKKRLGSVNDADDLVNHPWFADIDWKALMDKQMPSPFLPDMEQIRTKQSSTIVHKDAMTSNEELVSLEEDERNDRIPISQQKLIEKHQNKFKDF